MKTPAEYYAIAREMFLSVHPELQSSLNNITLEEASMYDMTLEQFRARQADRIYASFLRQKNQDAILFSIQLAEPDKKTANKAIEQYLKSHAEALGMTWEEFCIKNNL